MAGTDLSRSTSAITERARLDYDPAQIKLIRSTVASECNDGELAMFLEICARYDLDPFSKQIWAIKIRGKVQIVVSRDGLLALANRSPDFRGCQSHEVREHDHFQTLVDQDGHVHVDHQWLDREGKPTHGGRDGQLRGDIIGGFAYVRREGHVDTMFMAYSAQYNKGENVWLTHPSAMSVKAAEAMALRKAFSISGVIGESEVPPAAPVPLTRPGVASEADYGPDEELAEKLQEAFQVLGYRPAKIRTKLRGCQTQEEREQLLAELNAEADLPEDAEVVEDEGEAAA